MLNYDSYLRRCSKIREVINTKRLDPTLPEFSDDLNYILFGLGLPEAAIVEVERLLNIDDETTRGRPTVAVSGGFDPLHGGHLDMIEEAARIGDVIVILNTDAWLERKKGFVFLPFDDRARILGALRGVVKVVAAKDHNNTVEETLAELRPSIFLNGGDRKEDNTPENRICAELGIEMRFNVGGGKTNSSSTIATRRKVQRKWGSYTVLHEQPNVKVKLLEIEPGNEGSPQTHSSRKEIWVSLTDGDVRVIQCNELHDLRNDSDKVQHFIEVQIGVDPTEDDIERY